MQLFEIKNDIAKILYTPSENHLLLADFLLIEDVNQSLIAQIIDIESTDNNDTNFATVKFALSINKNANLSTYNGYTPSKDANIIYIDTKEIAQLIQSTKTNIFWGYLASHPSTPINLGLSLLREKPYIQCDKVENATIIATNILYSLQDNRKRTIIIDFDGRYKKVEDATRIAISKEYKLPLNFNAFDFISENDLEDCSTENKAIIQGILLELQSYVDTLEDHFIPFEIFKSVIDEQCKQNPIPELIIFKNKLIKYQQKGLFAQSKDQFNFLNKILSKTSITIIDASNIEEKWHRFIIETIASQIEKKCYFIINLTDSNSKKQTINTIYENENIRPIPLSDYKYNLLPQLKSLCKNLILFAPIEKTNDFEIYNSFLKKLNQKEFIIWSENTFYMPLILKLKALNKDSFSDTVNDEIKYDVDQMFTAESVDEGEIQILPANNDSVEDDILEDNDESVSQLESFEFEEEYLDEGFIENELEIQSESEPIQEETLMTEETIIESEPAEELIEEQEIIEFHPTIDDVTDDDLDYLDNLDIEELEETEDLSETVAVTEPEELSVEKTDEKYEEIYIDESKTSSTESFSSIPTNDSIEINNADEDEDDDDDDLYEEEYIAPQQTSTEPKIVVENINIPQEPSLKVVEPTRPTKAPETIIVDQRTKEAELETIIERVEQATPTQKIPTPPTPVSIPKKPSVPIYEAKVTDQPITKNTFKEGNFVYHAKYGKGIVEKIITYGNKTLCSIQFDNVGRRLLDPNLADIQLI